FVFACDFVRNFAHVAGGLVGLWLAGGYPTPEWAGPLAASLIDPPQEYVGPTIPMGIPPRICWRNLEMRNSRPRRVLRNRSYAAMAGCRKRGARIAPQAQAVFRRRRHQPRRPPPAKIRPGSPAPAMGPGTGVGWLAPA